MAHVSTYLADFVLVLHALWVAVVVLLVPLVALGGRRGWRWIRLRWVRHGHLAMIGVVVAEAFLGIACPLTVWERELRKAAGEGTYEESFVAHWLNAALFYRLPPWVFTVAYVAFFGLVVLLYATVPPVKAQRGASEASSRPSHKA